MSDFDTVKAITENLQALLKSEGIHFSKKAFEEDKSIPASLLPYGQVSYAGETFERTYGQKPGYAEAEFQVKVVIKEREADEVMAAQQDWVHRIRDAVTVDSLNTGALAASKLVSRVSMLGASAENGKETSSLKCRLIVRYREV